MQCKNCGARNSFYARHCIKCGNYLIEGSNEYCPVCNKPLLFPDKPCPNCNKPEHNEEEFFCSECNTTLKKGLLVSNLGELTDLERVVLELDHQKPFCDKCTVVQRNKASSKLKDLKSRFRDFLHKLPVISVEVPVNMQIIKYCGIVTGQSVVKVSDIKETYTKDDALNLENTEFGYKLSFGENSCLLSVKRQCLKLGANAVVKCDINYGELGNTRNAFLVGMMGTAVIVEEFEILTDYEQNVYNFMFNSAN
jgi:uncharacterized protein YbjQ (UPF0145 family)